MRVSYEPKANVVRMESVTHSVACWWLRAVSAVSSLWFMDTEWTLVSKSQLKVQSSNCVLFFLAEARLDFLCLHAKVFHTAINFVLVWVRSPTGLAKPFIILGAWNYTALSQVVVVNNHRPNFFGFPQMRGRYSSFKALPFVHLSDVCFFCAGVRQKGNVISHGSFVIW